MLVTFNSVIPAVAPSADGIYPLKLLAPFYVFYAFPPQGAGVFPLKTGVYPAFIYINTFCTRNSF
jgi:hypothetical protein